MSLIKDIDFIDSITDGLQYISYYHPPDFIEAMSQAYAQETSVPARDAMAQILINSRLCAQGHRPLCQDTGIVTVFLDVGMNVSWEGNRSIDDMVNEAVARAYQHADNPLRASIVSDPAGTRKNTGNNAPAVIHTRLVPGHSIKITLAAKGGGSENKAKLAMLNPSDNIVDWVLETVPTLGAGWCPPGVLGIGIGGTAEKAMLMAKEALMAPIDIHTLQNKKTALTTVEALRLELFNKVNALGIGAQGLGGMTTVLDIKILDYPTHATSKPVALIPNCAATRHIHFTLDGTGPARLPVPKLEDWPTVSWQGGEKSRRVNLNTLSPEDIQHWKPGETLLLTGSLLTGRDAAHKRLADMFARGQTLPPTLDFRGKFIYYVGPVDAVGTEAVGPAGPTTATRMDKFTDMMLDNTGILGMIGKAERGPQAIQSIKKHGSVYLIATGGAAYLISQSIKSAKVIAFEDLGMEAIHEFEVEDMPVTVAVDSKGTSVHETGPAEWRIKLSEIGRKP